VDQPLLFRQNLLYSRIHLKWISLCYSAKSWRQNTFRVFHWKCSTPLYSWSASLIGSAYLFLYISFCFWFNKLLRNLTPLWQHLLLLYWWLSGNSRISASIKLITVTIPLLPIRYFNKHKITFNAATSTVFSVFLKTIQRDFCSSQNELFLLNRVLTLSKQINFENGKQRPGHPASQQWR
jgi:hypothetical protein